LLILVSNDEVHLSEIGRPHFLEEVKQQTTVSSTRKNNIKNGRKAATFKQATNYPGFLVDLDELHFKIYLRTNTAQKILKSYGFFCQGLELSLSKCNTTMIRRSIVHG